MIVIDSITNLRGAVGTLTFTQRVSSPDAVLVIFVGCDPGTGTNVSTVKVNGVNLPEYSHVSSLGPSVSESFLMFNPPVGVNTVTVAIAVTSLNAVVSAITLLGVSKRTTNPVIATNSAASGSPSTVTIQAPSANSLILDHIYLHSATTGTLVPDASQTQIQNEDDGNGNPVGVSFKYGGNSLTTSTWTLTTGTNWAATALAFEPDQAPSIWFPNYSFRNNLDVVNRANLNTGTTPTTLVSAGYFPTNFYLNSFLHTVGRILSPSQPVPAIEVRQPTSSIIIDNITESTTTAATLTVPISISSQDAVLVVLVATNSASNGSATFNGTNLRRITGPNGSGETSEIYYYTTPAVGTYDVVVTGGAGTTAMAVTVISLLGVDKTVTVPIGLGAGGSGSTTFNTTANTAPAANTFVLTVLAVLGISTVTGTSGQTLIQNTPLINSSLVSASGFGIIPGNRVPAQSNWTFNTAGTDYVLAVLFLTPNNAFSLFRPSIGLRNNLDVVSVNGLNAGNTPTATTQFGYHPSTFFLNSFLHTVGRINPPPVQPTLTAETERPTSQIIIDKVFQGQKTAQALSIVSLTMDISIPSLDAVLVVTGGSVIATGAQWSSVQFNGNPLTNLIQIGVAGTDAEIWYLPFPPVGVGQLTITSGTGGEIYANAMVVLGVDKRSTNIKVASATDAAVSSTISVPIIPDAPNSLIIDTLATLDTFIPVQDSSQNQVFNASALATNEQVFSSYKIGNTSGEQMNWNLGIAVNASLVTVSFKPANAASIWYPNIDFRSLNDVVDSYGLDAEINPSFGQYGYKPSTFYLNSFLHTVGRLAGKGIVITNSPQRMLMGYGF